MKDKSLVKLKKLSDRHILKFLKIKRGIIYCQTFKEIDQLINKHFPERKDDWDFKKTIINRLLPKIKRIADTFDDGFTDKELYLTRVHTYFLERRKNENSN